MQSLSSLNQQFAIPDVLEFSQVEGGLIIAEINNDGARAKVALQGATVIAFRPHGEEPVIWLSEDAKFVAGKSIRGGAPVCWPWFGPHASDAKLPGHGYARTTNWNLIQADALDDDLTQLVFELEENDATRAQWPNDTPVRCVVTVGRELSIELSTTNKTANSVTVGQALHTYFHVDDVRYAYVTGLNSCSYIDKVDGGKRKQQNGNVTIAGEVDRIYLNTPAKCMINDPGLQRTIRIRCEGSHSTVVWNPGEEKANKMGDLGPNGYLKMLCVETANAADDVVTIAPGESYSMKAIYSVGEL